MSPRGRVRNRREVLARATRWATLGLLGGLVAGAAARDRRLRRQGICPNQGLCAGCGVLGRCDLPPARQARSNRGIDDDR
ncbi:MAG TPA: hypothetical protein ENN87_09945 [Phycisphaerales bacterium]|nr:hypothetical protein [Phycisphaerales bacterium]